MANRSPLRDAEGLTREDRRLLRMRGAGRHNIDPDLSFGFNFAVQPENEPSATAPEPSPPPPPPIPSPPPASAPAPRTTDPNTSAKRRRVDDTERKTSNRSPDAARSSGQRAQDVYDFPETSTEPVQQGTTAVTGDANTSRDAQNEDGDEEEEEEDELASLPRPTPRSRTGPRRSNASVVQEQMIEIVSESPAGAPGSGRREWVSAEKARTLSTARQRVVTRHERSPVDDEQDEISMDMSGLQTTTTGNFSSPLVRKAARKSAASRASTAAGARSRLSGQSTSLGEIDELSPAAGHRTSGRLSGGSASLGELDELSPATATISRAAAGLRSRVIKGSPAGRRASGQMSGASAEDETDELSPEKSEKPTEPATAETAEKKTAKRKAAQPSLKSPVQESDPSPEKLSEQPPAKKPGGRPRKVFAKNATKPSLVGEPEEIDELGDTRETATAEASRRPRRGRPRKSIASPNASQEEQVEPEEQDEAEPEEQDEAEEEQEGVEEEQEEPEEDQEEAGEEQPEEEEPEEAEEIDVTEAARRLGRKRPRASLSAPESPESEEVEVEENVEPVPKRRRRKPLPQSPAAQHRPKTRKEKAQEIAKTKKPRAKSKSKAAADGDGESDEAQRGSVLITVQRFTKPSRKEYDAGGDDDVLALHGPIPFANRAGVNAVDVLAQLCSDFVERFLGKLQQRREVAEGTAEKREVRTMAHSLQTFHEELQTRLLGHTIALDNLAALQKHIRVAQKQKLALRQEILEIRAEREQVALKMDAVRIKHEEESKEALQTINLSSTMHDIDLAVERGLAAPPLSAAEQSEADLENLEYLVSMVTEQACTNSDSGGVLKQLRDTNAFLERAALALEGW